MGYWHPDPAAVAHGVLPGAGWSGGSAVSLGYRDPNTTRSVVHRGQDLPMTSRIASITTSGR